MAGWIRIHRQINEHWLWKDPRKLKWWLDILLEVNYKENKVNIGYNLIECKRGQSIKSLKSWADRWGISKDSARHFLHLLEKDNMIMLENLKFTTRLTVCNYDKYNEPTHEEQTESKRRTNGKQTEADPNKKEKKEKNGKNRKKSQGEKDEIYIEIIENYKNNCPNMPEIKLLTDQRKKTINARLKEHGIEMINQILEIAGRSDFLNGKNDKRWKANFDWLMKPLNFVKIMEGNYNNNKQHDLSKIDWDKEEREVIK